MRISAIILFLIAVQAQAQQTAAYAQYMFNGLLLNPAYAGADNALNVTAMYRQQWLRMEGAPVAQSISAHSPLKNKKVNLGVVLENDQFGVFNHTRLNMIYAYRLKLREGKLSLGLSAGMDAYRSNWNEITTARPNDPRFSGGSTRTVDPFFGVGSYYHNDRLTCGVSLPQLFLNGLNKYQTVVVTAGYNCRLSEDLSVKPALLLKYQPTAPVLFNVTGSLYFRNVVGIGAGIATNSSFVAVLDVRLNEQLHFGYGYTQLNNELRTYTGGTHEGMLRYIFSYRVKSFNPRFL